MTVLSDSISTADAPASKFTYFVVISATCVTSLYSFGVMLPYIISVPTIYLFALSIINILVTGRIRIDGITHAAVFYLLTLSVATIMSVGHGADIGSFLRVGVWFFIFFLLYDSFCRIDYNRALTPILWFSATLAVIHLVQLAEVYLGWSPSRIVPDAWHTKGEVSWNEDWETPRPAAIFTEISWFAFYQVIILSLALVWAQIELTRIRILQIGVILLSLFWSGSLTGIILSAVVLGLWALKSGRISAARLIGIGGIFCVFAAFILISPIGQHTLQRLLLEQGSGNVNLRVVYPWLRALDAVGNWPLSGVGIGNEPLAGRGTVPESDRPILNLFAYFLATTGLLGTSGLFVLIIAIGRRFPLELGYFLLLGFASANGLGENFWVPTLLWAGAIVRKISPPHISRLRAERPGVLPGELTAGRI